MSSGTCIIQEALEEIGAHSDAAPALPVSIVRGKDVLNSMLQLWLSRGIDLGIVPLDAPADELNEPLDARNAIVKNLAMLLEPKFSNGKLRASPTLMADAKSSFEDVRRLYKQVYIPKKRASSTLPRGAGAARGDAERIYVGRGHKLNG